MIVPYTKDFYTYLNQFYLLVGNINLLEGCFYLQNEEGMLRLIILDCNAIKQEDSADKILKLLKKIDILNEINVYYFVKIPSVTFENMSLLRKTKIGEVLNKTIKLKISIEEQEFLIFKKDFFDKLFSVSDSLSPRDLNSGQNGNFKLGMSEIAINQKFYILDSNNDCKNYIDL